LSAFIVTVQLLPDVLLQPVHELKVLLPDVAGAVNVTDVPLLKVRVNWVEPLPCPFLSLGLTVIGTPLPGFVEATVNTRWGVT
jgi:hypothetical protein